MDLQMTINRRRAYRSLLPVQITEEIVQDLAASARLAPSCFNNQPWRYLFVYEEHRLREVFTALNKGNQWAERASLIIAVFSEPDLDCRIKGRDYFLFDTGAATGFLILKATEMDLVAHPIAGFDEDMVKEILHIPDYMTVITLLIVGKRASDLNPVLSEKQREWEKTRPKRIEVDEFIFRNDYTGD
jgi:nitroreductase